MFEMQAVPFVPGRVRGTVRHGLAGAGSGNLVVLSRQELDDFSGPCAGLIVLGIAPLAHPMIRLLGLAAPGVMVDEEQGGVLAEGLELILDGDRGLLYSLEFAAPLPPGEEPAAPVAGAAICTADRQRVYLSAGVSSLEAVRRARRNGAYAIGSLRSEYLGFDHAVAPDAECCERTLREFCAAARPLPVTLRLPDIAIDKQPRWLGALPGMDGPLGLRGARLYHIEPVRGALGALLEAVSRLAAEFDIRLLIPFLTSPEEFIHLRREIEDALAMPMSIGAMVETPAAALMMREFLAAADFIDIGCNDLMQCLYAADRDVPQVAPLLDPYAPAMFRLLRLVAEQAGARQEDIQLCGMYSQVPGVLPALLGLGYRRFNVDPLFIPLLARRVAATDSEQAQVLAQQVCAAEDARSVIEIIGRE